RSWGVVLLIGGESGELLDAGVAGGDRAQDVAVDGSVDALPGGGGEQLSEADRVAAEHRDVLPAAVVPGPLVRREIDLDPGAQQSGELLVVRARAAQDPLESRRMMQHIGELPRAQQRRGPESGTR